MYEINPPEVIVLDRVRRDPQTAARLERMLKHITTPSILDVDDAGLSEIVDARGWLRAGKRTGQFHQDRDPAIIFSTYRWGQQEDVSSLMQKYPMLRSHGLLGTGAWGFRDSSVSRQLQKCVCQSAYEIHCAFGCLHACDYCHVLPYFNIMLDMETLAGKVREFGETIPHQALYKFDNQTDQITLEPEYGASKIMVEMFADWPGRFLLLYTKSDNVDHLLDLNHRGHTLISWSIAAETAASKIERKTPSLERRIDAMARCQDAGYRVRIRFSPMCPLKNWREEHRDMIQRVLARVKPEVISVDIIGWMNPDQMKDAIDMDLFDPDYVAALDRRIAEGFKRDGKHVFPHEMRADILRFVIEEIKRVRPEQAVSLCMETTDMWRELGGMTGMEPDSYVCCCGPTSVPGNPLMSS